MAAVVKIKIRNSSGVELVRFIGVHFDGYTFSFDVADGDMQPVSHVHNGSIGLTAFRVSDERVLGQISYPVSDSMGFAAILLYDEQHPSWPYLLVGEPFVIPER